MNENLKEGIIMQHLNWIVPVVGLIGFLFAVVTRAQVIKQDPGTEKMRVIADAIAEGARDVSAAAELAAAESLIKQADTPEGKAAAKKHRASVLASHREPTAGLQRAVSWWEAPSPPRPVIWE